MKIFNVILTAFAMTMASAVYADELPEWNNPENISYGKEAPHAWFFSFENIDSARKLLPENSRFYYLLDGKWSFFWSPDPESRPADFYKKDYDISGWDEIEVPSNWNVYGLQKDGSQKYGTPIYVNQQVIFKHSVMPGDWKGGVMRTPPADWTVAKARNETGSYRRTFVMPKGWDGREVFVNFDGVDSFFYLWVNGEYVGFSKNSRSTAEFDITPFLANGENVIAVEVYRNSDGSFLEAQDMFRLPGIFRSVYLTSRPKLHIRDIRVNTDFDADYADARLNIETEVRNMDRRTAKGYYLDYSLYKNEIYGDDNEKVAEVGAKTQVPVLAAGNISLAKETIMVKSPEKWSAESPVRYVLVAQLKNRAGRVIETVSAGIGFREVEIKDTPASADEFGLAGRYWYLNGKTIKLKGVNRHDTNPNTGHVVSREDMERDIMMMKRANINHVRGSHYPNDPYWYYLCDKYGIYLEEEANIESHEYYYGDASLSHPKEWEAAHVDRVLAMVHAQINHPSVVIWSLGNEAGPGQNFVAAYNALKLVDKSRPVQYERNNDIVDMGSNQYPSIDWTRRAVTGKMDIKYPFHISEYAHSMGNACGNLSDYWKAIESTNYLCGGAIWDWIDQAIYNYNSFGVRYLAYGGDFGDKPNDGQFVMNGIIFADHTPKPQYYEVRKVYQYIDVIKSDDLNYRVFNKNYFIDLSYADLKWTAYADGMAVADGMLDIGKLAPRNSIEVKLPSGIRKEGCENIVSFEFILKENTPWAGKGYVVAAEQFELDKPNPAARIQPCAVSGKALGFSENEVFAEVTGEGFKVVFDKAAGTIYKLDYYGNPVICNGGGPVLNAFRAFTNNDNWFYESWFENGLHNLRHKVLKCETGLADNGDVRLMFTVRSQAPNGAKIKGGTSSGNNSIEEYQDKPFGDEDFMFTAIQTWTVRADGSILLEADIDSNKPEAVLPRLGYIMRVPAGLDSFSYYGRGPVSNYPDRKTGQFVGIYHNTVAGEFEPFPKPQEMGNHEDVRWCSLTDKLGCGIEIVAADRMSASVSRYSAMDMTLAGHIIELPQTGDTYLCVDKAVTGLGGNSCGQGGPLAADCVKAGKHHFSFVIRKAAR